jgi:hypothetical protein
LRCREAIVSWVYKKTGPPAVTVTKAEELEAAEKKRDAVALGYFADFNSADDKYATFKEVAAKKDNIEFLQTSDKAVAAAAGLKAPGTFAILTNFPVRPCSMPLATACPLLRPGRHGAPRGPVRLHSRPASS